METKNERWCTTVVRVSESKNVWRQGWRDYDHKTSHDDSPMSVDDINAIKADLKALVAEKNCGPIFIRLSWHDAGKWSSGKLTGGECLLLFVGILKEIHLGKYIVHTCGRVLCTLNLQVLPRPVLYLVESLALVGTSRSRSPFHFINYTFSHSHDDPMTK